jgi:hypothetical protein
MGNTRSFVEVGIPRLGTENIPQGEVARSGIIAFKQPVGGIGAQVLSPVSHF